MIDPNAAFRKKRSGINNRLGDAIVKSFIMPAKPKHSVIIKAMGEKDLRTSAFIMGIFTEDNGISKRRYVRFINNLVYRYESFLHQLAYGQYSGLSFIRAKQMED